MKWTKEELAKLPEKNRENIERIMQKYGDNKWWELEEKDPITFAYYQFQHPDIFMGKSINNFKEGIELLIGRPIHTHDLVDDREKLKEEIEEGWKYYQKHGKPIKRPEEYVEEKMIESFKTFEECALKHGKEIISIDSSKVTAREAVKKVTEIIKEMEEVQ